MFSSPEKLTSQTSVSSGRLLLSIFPDSITVATADKLSLAPITGLFVRKNNAKTRISGTPRINSSVCTKFNVDTTEGELRSNRIIPIAIFNTVMARVGKMIYVDLSPNLFNNGNSYAES